MEVYISILVSSINKVHSVLNTVRWVTGFFLLSRFFLSFFGVFESFFSSAVVVGWLIAGGVHINIILRPGFFFSFLMVVKDSRRISQI
jgi:hypothetical protein